MSKLIRPIHPTQLLTLALALSVLVAPLTTFSVERDPVVLVTATRFQDASPAIAANVSVITRADIERSPARSLPDLLIGIPGVDVRPLYGSLGIDAVVDLRGSGEAAGSNTLILVDGQRLNPVDSGGVKWETIPLGAVSQIEVIRGGGAVLYGDRAAAGVINIITDKRSTSRLAAKFEAGTFGSTAIDAFAAGRQEHWEGNLFVHDAATDGYRVNGDARQISAGGRGAYRVDEGEVFLAFSAYRERYGLPGALNAAQYRTDARQSSNPNYRLERNGQRLSPGGSIKIGRDLRVDVDGSHSDDLLKSENPDWYYRSQTRVKSDGLSPRLKWAHGLAFAAASETVAGLDVYSGKATADDLDFLSRARQNRQTGQQSSEGLYLHNLTRWHSGVSTTVAIRRQHFKQEMTDVGANLLGQGSSDLSAWELGLSYAWNSAWRAYVKTAKNFRLPNTDELFAYDPVSYKVRFNGALQPQTGRLLEGGLSWSLADVTQQLTVFRQDNHDEIGYVAANGRNANLDATRRQGAEWEARWQLAEAWVLRGSLTAIRAEFDRGVFSGKRIPLVPAHKQALSVQWDGVRDAHTGTHTLSLVRVGSRYFGGDFANAYAQLEGYTRLDYQAQWHFKPYSVILRAANLTDRKYSATGFSSAFNPGTYYPADPRSVSLAFKAEF